jgi:uncharacterized membrane protein
MNELARLSLGWNQVIPPPRTHGRIDLQYSIGYGVTTMVVVKQPAVKPVFPKRRLNLVEFHFPSLPS